MASGQLRCTHCQAPIPAGKKFCPQCGTAVPISRGQVASPKLILPTGYEQASAGGAAASLCPQCQTAVPAGKKFCPQCGAAVGAAAYGGAATHGGGPLAEAAARWGLSRWDVSALMGGGAGAVLWYGWSAWGAAVDRSNRGGDTQTSTYILLLPVLLIVFRKPFDRLLTPLQAVKDRIPRLVLIGAGLAVPYVLAHYFYVHRRIENFPLAQQSILWGTIVSYVILRIPQQPAPRLQPVPGVSCFWWALQLALLCLPAGQALADDFFKDPRRLEDGLRTPGAAQAIAGTAATVINALVNGALVFQRRGPRAPTTDRGEEQARYDIQIDTENRRTDLAANNEDSLWIYGRVTCNKPKINTQAITAGMTFAAQGANADWLMLTAPVFHGEHKAVQLRARAPYEGAHLQADGSATIVVTATIEGAPQSVPVTLRLSDENFDLEMDVWT